MAEMNDRAIELKIDREILRSLLVLASVVEARDPYTGGHIWRVAEFSRLLAERGGLGDDEVFATQLAGLTHDIGKVGVPDRILTKPGPLDDAEWAVMRHHPATGRKLLEDHPIGTVLIDAVDNHHERLDGRGYSKGLNAEQISRVTRIVTVADAFDAMTSTRPYRKGMPKERAVALMGDERRTQFDEAVLANLEALALGGGLDHVLGHSYIERKLVHCPVCGPVVALAGHEVHGDHVQCPVCRGKMKLRDAGGGLEAVPTGKLGGPRVVTPDYEVVDDIVNRAPDFLKF